MRQNISYGFQFSTFLIGVIIALLISLLIIIIFLILSPSEFFVFIFLLILFAIFVFEYCFINLSIKRYKKKVDYINKNIVKISKLNGDEIVLDLGTGSGATVIAFAKKLKKGKAIGLDYYIPPGDTILRKLINFIKINHIGSALNDANEIAKFEKVDEKCQFFKEDISKKLSFKNKKFDIITSRGSLYCISSKNHNNLFDEIDRVLKKEGKIIFQEPKKFFSWNMKKLEDFFQKKGYKTRIIRLPKSFHIIFYGEKI